MRESHIRRKTGETDITLTLNLDGTGNTTSKPASGSSTTCSRALPATGPLTSP